MSKNHDPCAQFAITLTEEERAQLLAWLDQRLRNKLVEEHRTDTAAFREHVRHQEEILEGLLAKLR